MAGKDFSITVNGAQEIAAKFRKIAQTSPGTFDKTMGRWANRTANQLKKKAYPPTRPNQRYKRTRRLKGAWAARRNQSLEWSIDNDAANPKTGRNYAGYVVGDQQAWMHKGRWWMGSAEVEAKIPELVKSLEGDIKRFMY